MKKITVLIAVLLFSTAAWSKSIWQMSSQEVQYKATARVMIKLVKKQATIQEKKNIKRLKETKTESQIHDFYESYRQDYLFPADQHWLKQEWDQADQVLNGFVSAAESFLSFEHQAEKKERCSVYAYNYIMNTCAGTSVKQKNAQLLKDHAKTCKKEYNLNDLLGGPNQESDNDAMFCTMLHAFRVDMQLGFEKASVMSSKELADQMWMFHQENMDKLTSGNRPPSTAESEDPQPKQKLGDRLLKSIF